MGRITFCLSVFICVCNASFSQYKLEIEVTGLKNNNGKIMLQLFDKDRKVIKEEMRIIKDNKCFIVFEDITGGKYALRYYHDENQNGKMETNSFGKPTEGYGFSNNVIGKFGPPSYEKWLFNVNSNIKMVLKPTY